MDEEPRNLSAAVTVQVDGSRSRRRPPAPVIVAVAAAMGLAGCGPRPMVSTPGGATSPSRADRPMRLEVAAVCELARDTSRPSSDPARVGGLSGLLHEPERGTYLAVSDDQRVPRMYRLRLAIDGHDCRAEVLDTMVLRWPDDATPAREARDFEDLTRGPDGSLLLVNEHDAGPLPITMPGLHRFTEAGQYIESIPVPPHAIPGPGSGVRDNAAFEGVTMSRGGDRIYVAPEQPLVQDDDVATFARGGASRLFEYHRDGDRFLVGRELIVPIDPLPHPGDILAEWADTGIVSLVTLDDGSLLMMERSFVKGTASGRPASRNDILLSRIRLDRADDVTPLNSLRGALARPVEKQRLLSLREVIADLPPWLAMLDNFEGMTLGPRLADGSASLVLVSDDNFSEAQRTAFIVLRIR